MESKKSIQLSQAFGAVLTLILVAVLVIIAIVIFVSLETSFEGIETTSVVNESVAIDVITGQGTVAGAAACGFNLVAPGNVYNDSNELIAITTDYTFSTSTGVITNVTPLDSPLKVNYDYNWGSGACDASDDMTTEFGNYTSLIGLVGTIIFLGLVIGILVAAFAFGGRRET